MKKVWTFLTSIILSLLFALPIIAQTNGAAENKDNLPDGYYSSDCTQNSFTLAQLQCEADTCTLTVACYKEGMSCIFIGTADSSAVLEGTNNGKPVVFSQLVTSEVRTLAQGALDDTEEILFSVSFVENAMVIESSGTTSDPTRFGAEIPGSCQDGGSFTLNVEIPKTNGPCE
ncbi:MAG: hypothetical protein LBE38_04265 [Deltaproteobacteria bacterium]|jgi:hypothetical protein|nr:hypothetical protein [Deltaproteobacteria bacterium]